MYVMDEQDPTIYFRIPELKISGNTLFPETLLTELKNSDDLGFGLERSYEIELPTLALFMHAYKSSDAFRNIFLSGKEYKKELLSTWIESRKPKKRETVKKGYMPVRLINKPRKHYNHKTGQFDPNNCYEFFDVQCPETGFDIFTVPETGLPKATDLKEEAKRALDIRYGLSVEDLLMCRYNNPSEIISDARGWSNSNNLYIFELSDEIQNKPLRFSTEARNGILVVSMLTCYNDNLMYREVEKSKAVSHVKSHKQKEENKIYMQLDALGDDGKPIIKEFTELEVEEYFAFGGKGKIIGSIL